MGDVSRRTWDKEEYAARAAEREAKIKEEGKARYEAAAAGKKYHRRASTPPDARFTEAREQRVDVASMVGKTMLVPAGAGQGKRGKGAGFYCETCDLTFKDNVSYIEHLNSRQHLVATGQTGDVEVATLDDVRGRLLWLKRKLEEEAQELLPVDLDARLDARREEEDREREEKRRKRNEKRRKNKGGADDGVMRYDGIENNGIIC
ncbi:hypothetical protein EJ04DRAFT_508522 [Polyplosphaeria fusca]|uniref:C2H2-type domain-containing protein n=1 Tax=Polyplosphaeria fusca TaxID=682080 RepID=A0A9P4V6B3_9PLEO|nr:hypothetical protein EJ04DRAFT_508522 [Polyplosphaeria fusca]